MKAYTFHMGIGFSVKSLSPMRWQWTVHPPKDVLGFKVVSGEVTGERVDAVEAAKREIEAQDQLTN